MTTERKKLIEVALPLDEINQASAREKSIRHGHPSTLHLWWARRPLAACRAVLFASIVDDPSSRPDLFPTEAEQERERERLFGIIRRLVQWENSTNEEVLREAREEILKATNGAPPPVLDPFCGGGSIPLEAQRLGLEAHASDLNPVAVLITKALIEIPPKFAGRAPVSHRAGSLGSAGILPASKSSEAAAAAALPASDPNLAAETAALPAHDGSAGILPARATREAAETAALLTAALPATNNQPKLWYSRGYVPHFDHPGLVQFITFRLVDSLPRDVIERLIHAEKDDIKRREQLEAHLDAGHGQCLLQDPALAAIVENALLHFDGQRYRLLSWVIMPNHVHVLIETFPGHPLSTIVHSWKSYTAKEINRRIGREGEVWQREYFDRYIRNERHLTSVIDYIENNPVKAGLVARPDEWPFGSARRIRSAAGSADGSAGILPAHSRNEAAGTAALPNEAAGSADGSAGILPAHSRNEAAGTAALPNEAAGSADGSAGILPAHSRNEAAGTAALPNEAAGNADGSAGILPAGKELAAAGTAALPGFDHWPGARGLAEDVRFYGAWMRAEAAKRIGHLYPAVEITPEMAQERPDLKPLVGQKLTVIAWLWARTVRCPNPACGAEMPLVASFWLSTKKGKEAWVEPLIQPDINTVRFKVRSDKGKPPEETVTRRGAHCIVCGAAVPFNHVRAEGQAGRMSARLMAIVAEGAHGRIYLEPTPEHEQVGRQETPRWAPSIPLPKNPRDFKTPNYGLTTFADLFTPRQLVALTTFSDLVAEARERVRRDAVAAGLPDDGVPLNDGGTGATAYADAVATYLAFAVDRLADRCSTICSWDTGYVKVRNTFGRQAIPMTWDFAEANPFSDSTGNFLDATQWIAKVLDHAPALSRGHARQVDAAAASLNGNQFLVSTDPPYYDNIGYADLSDFFYVWLRRALMHSFPDLFRTLLVPKSNELIASPYRHDGDRRRAQDFFEEGLLRAFQAMRQAQHPDFPMTVYYAFKQAEEDDGSPDGTVASTGWETMLEGLLRAGFAITGTWPMRTELGNRMIGRDTNALASSIVVVCRPRPADASVATRRQFLAALRAELPDALIRLQHGNIAPVDLAQAAIGPGMAVFSRYARVLEADGSPMSVRTALALINQELDAYLEAQEGELDPETRFCIAWYEQHGLSAGPYGEADVLARAKNTAVNALERAGIVESKGGKVRLLRRDELPAGWDPERDRHKPVWECMQQVIRRFETEGAAGAGALLGRLGADLGEQVRALAYRLYTLCERRGRAEEALAYNGLVIGWHDIQQQVPAGFTARQERFDV